MENAEKKNVINYLLISFAVGWGLEIGGLFSGSLRLYRALLSVAMLAPALAVVVIYRGKPDQATTGIHWQMKWGGHKIPFLMAWLMPSVLTLAGCALYFAIFPDQYDPSFGALGQAIGSNAEVTDLHQIMLSQLINSVTWGPLVNAFFALGEEIGWRGYMTPMFQKRFGRKKGIILAGTIWSIWHWPLIILAGYQYGVGYPGAPWTGLVVNTFFMIAAAILLSWLYEHSESIMAPAIAHGGMNAVGAIGLYMMHSLPQNYLLGPTIGGVISVLPAALIAAIAMWKDQMEIPDVKNPGH